MKSRGFSRGQRHGCSWWSLTSLSATWTFEILVPVRYAVDELPPATDIEDGFASYHSKTEFSGRTLKYSRTLEIRQLSVPPAKADELKLFYRKIAEDERSSAVLKRPKP